MSESAHTALFPLPVTVFERYMLDDDRADYPMTYLVNFRFSGEIRRPEFEAAIDEAIGRHPLLCARLAKLKGRGLCFVEGPRQRSFVDWGSEGMPLRFPNGRAIDLTREAGIRLWVRVGDGTVTLSVQFHHACCDGLGAFRFVGDLFGGYALRTATQGPRPVCAPLDPECLRTRGQFPVEFPEPVSTARALWSTVCEATKWIVRRPEPLAVPGPLESGAGDDDADSGLAIHRFDEQQSQLLRQIASRSGATLNDLLLRDLFLTMQAWNEQYRSRRGRSWLQINMPQSLRGRSGDAMPAANRLSYVFLTRRSSELRDAKALLEGIRAETTVIKQWSLGLFFLAGMGVAQKVPGLCRRVGGGKICFATALLTNVGDLRNHFQSVSPDDQGRLVVGNLRLDAFSGVPPLRRMTHAGFVAFTYAKCLNINVRTDDHRFPPGASRGLLAYYVRQIERTMSEST